MAHDSLVKSTLAPFVLRLAMAAIFIYHGYSKIAGEDNVWGAKWATNLWHRQGSLPSEVKDKMEQLEKEKEKDSERERVRQAKDTVAEAYSHAKGIPPESLNYAAAQLAVAWGELLGGFALLFGILTRLVAVGLIVIQVGAILTVTAARGFSFANGGGYEYNIALIAMCVTLLLLGGGAWAADNFIFSRGGKTQQAPAAV
ncbi:MAG TPA: DoxX family protein [Gemmataceae bacterium]|nr:DoxX family protein [Gemmataceae bacterium]